MIKANELRVGNWIYTGSEFDKAGISFIYSVSPEQITARTNGVYQGFYLKGIAGIQLTPEVLEKCGFENQGYDLLFWGKGKIELVGMVYEDEKFASFYWNNGGVESESIDIHYLHQLQNLYFDLTGTELEYIP